MQASMRSRIRRPWSRVDKALPASSAARWAWTPDIMTSLPSTRQFDHVASGGSGMSGTTTRLTGVQVRISVFSAELFDGKLAQHAAQAGDGHVVLVQVFALVGVGFHHLENDAVLL